MERVVVLVARDAVDQQDIMEVLQMQAVPQEGGPLSLRQARARFERQYILARLSANRGNLGNTARELGIERTNLYRKMKRLGIQSPHSRPRT